jgi:hypothetical protein
VPDVHRLAPWMIVVVLAVAYPLAVLAGGAPRFPSRDDCVQPATRDGDIEAVFGRVESEREASALRDRALQVGFQGTSYERDACGRVKVFVPGIPTLAVGQEFAEQARTVGFEVTLEQAS